MAVVVQTIGFRGDGIVEIAYAEDREQSETFGMFRSMFLREPDHQDTVDQIKALIGELIDDGLERHRNPPDTLTPGT